MSPFRKSKMLTPKPLTQLLLSLPLGKRQAIAELLTSPDAPFDAWRTTIDKLWSEFFDLADRDFVEAFAISPNDRAWEMHLAVALRRANIHLEAPKPGPDFLMHDGERRIWVEAVVASPGEGPDQVPHAPFPTIVNAPEDAIVLRITNALERKVKKLGEYIDKGIIQGDDGFVIGVCSAIPNQIITSYHALRAVYGIGGWEAEFEGGAPNIVGSHMTELTSVSKSCGAEVATDQFLRRSWERVSGLLFSASPFVSNELRAGRDFSFLHNFAARYPLRWGWLRFHGEFRMERRGGQLYSVRSYGRGIRIPRNDEKV